MSAGQPTKYKKEYCEDIIKFFDREPFSVVTDEEGNPCIGRNNQPILMPAKLPTFESYAHSIKVHKDTIYEWAKVHPEFSDAKKRAQQLQHDILVQNGLNGSYNATFAIFTGKACLGMRDGNEHDQEAPKPLNITFNVENARVDKS